MDIEKQKQAAKELQAYIKETEARMFVFTSIVNSAMYVGIGVGTLVTAFLFVVAYVMVKF